VRSKRKTKKKDRKRENEGKAEKEEWKETNKRKANMYSILTPCTGQLIRQYSFVFLNNKRSSVYQ
jgi:hypothetical protein